LTSIKAKIGYCATKINISISRT